MFGVLGNRRAGALSGWGREVNGLTDQSRVIDKISNIVPTVIIMFLSRTIGGKENIVWPCDKKCNRVLRGVGGLMYSTIRPRKFLIKI